MEIVILFEILAGFFQLIIYAFLGIVGIKIYKKFFNLTGSLDKMLTIIAGIIPMLIFCSIFYLNNISLLILAGSLSEDLEVASIVFMGYGLGIFIIFIINKILSYFGKKSNFINYVIISFILSLFLFNVFYNFGKFIIFENGKCDFLTEEQGKHECWQHYAIKKGDLKICDKVHFMGWFTTSKTMCYEKIAELKNDSSICYQLPISSFDSPYSGSDYPRAACLTGMAVNLRNGNLCDSLLNIYQNFIIDRRIDIEMQDIDPDSFGASEKASKKVVQNLSNGCFHKAAFFSKNNYFCSKIINDEKEKQKCFDLKY